MEGPPVFLVDAGKAIASLAAPITDQDARLIFTPAISVSILVFRGNAIVDVQAASGPG